MTDSTPREPQRYETTLSLPEPGRDFTVFPARPLGNRCPRWYRTHSANLDPWWFASSSEGAGGRFDLPEPSGTLNTAESPETSARESLGHLLVGARQIPETSVLNRTISTLEFSAMKVADFNSSQAPQYGVSPGDVVAPQPGGYQKTQAWALAMHSAGHKGIVARSRFATASNKECLFIFGPSGANKPSGAEVLETCSLRKMVESMNYKILPTPSSEELDIR